MINEREKDLRELAERLGEDENRGKFEALREYEGHVKEREEKFEGEQFKKDKKNARFYKFLHTLFHVCEMADFEIVGRVTLKDRRTGKIWR